MEPRKDLTTTGLEQENKQLKEELEKETIWHDEAEYEIIKQKLETSYEALQRIRDERNEAWTKLETIKKLYRDSSGNEIWLFSRLKEILDSQEKE